MTHDDENRPLLEQHQSEIHDDRPLLKLSDYPDEDPRAWSRGRKLANVAVIATMSIISPLASSMFTPGISQIAKDLDTFPTAVIGTTTGFVVFLGIGPLILAPLSETFGRRSLYLTCFTIFALLQIPTALAPNIEFLIIVRCLSGFFGSVGIANGGGTISDMFEPSERAGVFGWYLLGPLLGPSLGPLFGGLTVQRLGWRWIFWILTAACSTTTLAGYLFLKETYAPILLARLKQRLQQDSHNHPTNYHYEGEDPRPLTKKLTTSLLRPPKILKHPIIATMSLYQALLFATTYSIYTNMQQIYQSKYAFTTEQVGLLYLAPGLGNLFAAWFLVPRIDDIYKSLTAKHDAKNPLPEYRLPLANLGAVLVPLSLFLFAWAVQFEIHWFASILPTFFFGIGMVVILNCTQNYYIDAFEMYAASAIAAGTVFRSLVGGIVPLFAPALFERLGLGWGISVFGFVGVVLAPAPVLFFVFGERIREWYGVRL